MSGPFDSKFTDEQRDAVALAKVDGGRTAKRVAEMAAAGELRYKNQPLPAFDIKPSYVADLATKLKRRRSGKVETEAAYVPARDGVEVLRRRLLNAAHQELEHEERKRHGSRDPERLRQIARCILEASRLPGPSDARPAPGTTLKADGSSGTRTTGGRAGVLMKEHRQTAPAQDNPQSTTDHGNAHRSNGEHEHRSNGQERGGPGALPSEREQELRAELEARAQGAVVASRVASHAHTAQ